MTGLEVSVKCQTLDRYKKRRFFLNFKGSMVGINVLWTIKLFVVYYQDVWQIVIFPTVPSELNIFSEFPATHPTNKVLSKNWVTLTCVHLLMIISHSVLFGLLNVLKNITWWIEKYLSKIIRIWIKITWLSNLTTCCMEINLNRKLESNTVLYWICLWTILCMPWYCC